jgi:F-type H+-transporting ATPase subunit alpha
MQLYAGTNKDDAAKRGWLRDTPVADITRWAKEFLEFCDAKYPQIQKNIESEKQLTDGIKADLNKALTEFNAGFQKTPGAKV